MISINSQVTKALKNNQPVVALESAVITHGLPRPTNMELARSMENIIKENGATPATMAFIKGKLNVGITNEELDFLGNTDDVHKISRRDFGLAAANNWNGGTTVAGTLIAAKTAGIHVFATGGIGGVHHGNIYDISADLQELSKSPVVVVCAGAKSILNLPATLEVLETMGVPVIGYQTDEFPAFYSKNSGLKTNIAAHSTDQIANIFLSQKAFKLNNSILVVNPIPDEYAIPLSQMQKEIDNALLEANKKQITGAKITPFLLGRIAEMTKGQSLEANLALLKNNAKLAADIAKSISKNQQKLQYI